MLFPSFSHLRCLCEPDLGTLEPLKGEHMMPVAAMAFAPQTDGLDDSRKAEEESKLCSVRSNSMDKLEICQTQDSEIVLCRREMSSGFTLKAVF